MVVLYSSRNLLVNWSIARAVSSYSEKTPKTESLKLSSQPRGEWCNTTSTKGLGVGIWQLASTLTYILVVSIFLENYKIIVHEKLLEPFFIMKFSKLFYLL